jgi:hypothetical protein
MTMTRPWRLMTLQLSHIVLTLARTFTVASFLFVRSVPLLVAVGDATSFEVVRSELYLDAIAWENTDVVHPHLARDMGQYFVAIFEFNTKHGIW